MSTKKKMIVSIASMCVVLIVAVVSVIAVWAATRASVQSNISISYKVGHVTGTMRARCATRTSLTDSAIIWYPMETAGADSTTIVSFDKDEAPQGDWMGYVSGVEETGIQPMALVEIQFTNGTDESYWARLSTSQIEHENIAEIYVVSASYTGELASYIPSVTDFYNLYKNDSTRDSVEDSGFEKSYEIKNDKTYCLYICVVLTGANSPSSSQIDFDISFDLYLSNAYAPGV